MKKLLVLSLTLILVVVTSCATSGFSELTVTPSGRQKPIVSPAATAVPYRIALVLTTLTNPLFVEMEKGARQAGLELDVELIIKTGSQETSVEQQIAIVDSLIRDKVDAIVISPADSIELVPVLKQAQDAGIRLVNIDNQLDPRFSEKIGLKNVPYIGVDDQQGAYLAARKIAAQVQQPTQALIITGVPDALNSEERADGALRAFGQNSNITQIFMESAEWKIDESYEVTRANYARHPDIGLIFCANDMMALGAIQYLQEKHISNVQVASFDGLEEARQAIVEGKLTATVDQQPLKQGSLGVKYAYRALQGEILPDITLLEVFLIDRENVSKF